MCNKNATCRPKFWVMTNWKISFQHVFLWKFSR